MEELDHLDIEEFQDLLKGELRSNEDLWGMFVAGCYSGKVAAIDETSLGTQFGKHVSEIHEAFIRMEIFVRAAKRNFTWGDMRLESVAAARAKQLNEFKLAVRADRKKNELELEVARAEDAADTEAAEGAIGDAEVALQTGGMPVGGDESEEEF